MADEQTRKYYRQRAPEYEQIYYRDNPPRRKEIDDEVLFVRELAAGKEVLDLACGTGYWTKVAAEHSRLVVAADISPEMIGQARGKEFVREPMFVVADLEQPPFAEGSFDLVLLGFWFSHQPKETYPWFFETLSGLVRQGGSIWMIDNNPPAEGALLHSVGSDPHGNNYKQRFLDNGDRYVILKNYFGSDELVSIVDPYFDVRRIVHKTYYWSMLLQPKTFYGYKV